MINANELRIGNLLIDVEDRICKVERIYEDDWTAYAIQGAITTGTPYPIELTEEILLNCGFSQVENYQEGTLGLNGIRIINHLGEWQWNDFSRNKKIPYLHQLQNLYFSLTGKELNTEGLV